MTGSSCSNARHRLAILALALTACTAGCVSRASLDQAVAERDRLARENLELRRSLAEEKVRAQEARSALRGGAPPTQEAGTPEPGASGPGVADSSLVESAPPIPTGMPGGPVDAGIRDEDLRTPTPGPPPSGAEGTLKVARSYAAAGRAREAIDAYTRLIGDYPFSLLLPEAFLERGRLRLRSGDRTGALEDFDTIAEAFPRSAQAGEARREAAALRGR